MTKESRAVFLKRQMYVLSLWLLFAMMIIASADVKVLMGTQNGVSSDVRQMKFHIKMR